MAGRGSVGPLGRERISSRRGPPCFVTGRLSHALSAHRPLGFSDPVVVMPRDKIILACSECKNRNYFSTKNKRLRPERVEWKKYCPRCNKHQVHKETK